MATFRSPFVRKDATRGSRPADGRLAAAGLTTAANDLGALPGIISGLAVSGVAGQWYYAVSAGHAVTVRSDADGANWPGLDGTTNTPTVAAAPGTGSRWDLIYIRQRDVDNADADSNSVIDVVQGTAGGSPTKPYASVPAGALVLAEAQVAADATGTLHANVVIAQVAAKVSTRGGIVPNPSTAQQALLNAAASATNPIWIDDAGVLKRSVGSGFRQASPRRLGATANATATTVAATPSWTTVATLTVTTLGGDLDVDGTVLLVNANSGADRLGGVRLLVDSTPAAVVLTNIGLRYVSGSTPAADTAFSWPVTGLAAASHTFALQANASAGSSVQSIAASLRVVEQP